MKKLNGEFGKDKVFEKASSDTIINLQIWRMKERIVVTCFFIQCFCNLYTHVATNRKEKKWRKWYDSWAEKSYLWFLENGRLS